MTSKIRIGLSIVFVLLYCLLSCLPINYLPVYASSIQVDGGYTSVLEDLSADEGFDPDNYPIKEDDYSLQVIQIAESSDKELFVYVYQPCSPNKDLMATSINISTKEDINSPAYDNYGLTLLNNNLTLYKYKVDNFIVNSDAVRYYDISSIFRNWCDSIDGKNGTSEITEVAYNVAKRFSARYDANGSLCYSSSSIKVIEITDLYTSQIRYSNGFYYDIEDRFFVAFSTDMTIDKLLEADVEFVHYTYKKITDLTDHSGVTSWDNITYEYGDKLNDNKTLYHDKKVSVQVGLIFKETYEWDEIQSVKTFIEDKDSSLSTDTITNLKKKDWVLNFYHAEYKEWADSAGVVVLKEYEQGTIVEDVTILRLKFETDETVYNLGAVSNKANSTGDIGNKGISDIERILNMIKLIFALILILILVVLLSPFLSIILPILFWIIKIAFKIVFWIISLPFKLFSKNKRRY